MFTHTQSYIYIYIYIERERERERKRERERDIVTCLSKCLTSALAYLLSKKDNV